MRRRPRPEAAGAVPRELVVSAPAADAPYLEHAAWQNALLRWAADGNGSYDRSRKDRVDELMRLHRRRFDMSRL